MNVVLKIYPAYLDWTAILSIGYLTLIAVLLAIFFFQEGVFDEDDEDDVD